MSALISTLLAIAIGAQTPALKSVTLDGRIIVPKLPDWTALESPAMRDGAIYVDGRPVAHVDQTSWRPFSEGAGIGDERALAWPTQIYIFDRSDRLSKRGFWRSSRNDFFIPDLRQLEQETALFVNMVRIATRGKIRIAPTWTLDEDVIFGNDDSLFAKEMLVNYFKPLVPNGHRSLLVVHPSLTAGEVLGEVHGTPFASVAFYRHADPSRPGQLARTLFNAWAATLPHHLREAGWSVPDTAAWPLRGPISPGAEIPLTSLDELLPAAAIDGWATSATESIGNRLPSLSPVNLSWDVAKDDLWSRLPRWNSIPDGTVGAVPLGLAAWMAKLGAKAVATVEEGGRLLIAFDQAVPAETTTSTASLLEPEVRDATSLTFSPGQAEKLPRSGWFEAQTVGDADRGSVGEIREVSLHRKGWVRMLGAFDPTKTPFLEFWIKPRAAAWPLDVWFDTGEADGHSVRLFGATQRELDLGLHVPSLDLRAEPAWQRAVIEVGKTLSRPVRAVYLRVPPAAEGDTMPREAPPALLVDDFELRDSASLTVTPFLPEPKPISPAADSTRPVDRARFIANADVGQADVIGKLLEDPDDLVKLNALAFFTAHPAVKPPLAPITRLATHFSSRMTLLAINLLAQDGSPEATDAMRRALQSGLTDFTKGQAAMAMPAIGERKILAEMTLLLNMKSPWARAAAVHGLSRQSFREADLVMLSFLNDTDPRVRMAVAGLIRLEQEAVLNRLQGTAQLDLSESVRGIASARLLGTTSGARVAPIVAKDPSRLVRILAVREAPPSASRQALAVMLAADADPLVAIAGLEALDRASVPADLRVTSRDPRVLFAWFQLADVAKLSIPADIIDLAIESRHAELAQLARKLKGSL